MPYQSQSQASTPKPEAQLSARELIGPFTNIEQIYTALTFGFKDTDPNVIKLIKHVKAHVAEPYGGTERSDHVRVLLRKPNYLVVDPNTARLAPVTLNCFCLTFECASVAGVNFEEYQRDPERALNKAIEEQNPDVIFLKADQHEEAIRTCLAKEHKSLTAITVFDPRDVLSAEIANSRIDIMRSGTFIDNAVFDAIIAFNMGIERLRLLAK